MAKRIEYKDGNVVGENKVVFIEDRPPRLSSYGTPKRRALFKCPFCDSLFETDIANVRIGDTVSCGCYNNTKRHTHNLTGTKLYRAWINIKTRCVTGKYRDKHLYMGRGIKLCDLWVNNPKEFVDYCKTLKGWDNPLLTIDRIDNDGHYEPGNIRFATPVEQSNNTRIYSTSTTGYRNVAMDRKFGGYVVTIIYNGVCHHIGRFKSLKTAVEKRNEYILKNDLPVHKAAPYINQPK